MGPRLIQDFSIYSLIGYLLPFFVLAVIPNIPSGHVLFWTEIPLLGWERVVLGLPGTS